MRNSYDASGQGYVGAVKDKAIPYRMHRLAPRHLVDYPYLDVVDQGRCNKVYRQGRSCVHQRISMCRIDIPSSLVLQPQDRPDLQRSEKSAEIEDFLQLIYLCRTRPAKTRDLAN